MPVEVHVLPHFKAQSDIKVEDSTFVTFPGVLNSDHLLHTGAVPRLLQDGCKV